MDVRDIENAFWYSVKNKCRFFFFKEKKILICDCNDTS